MVDLTPCSTNLPKLQARDERLSSFLRPMPDLFEDASFKHPISLDNLPADLGSERAHRICEGYIRGQLANVAKAAVWWSTFGVVAQAITQYTLAVGLTRFVFNAALVMVSPLAGSFAETVSIRSLLTTTTLARFLIWCLCLPAGFVGLVILQPYQKAFFIAFLILMYLDGVQVSFANVVDIDCGGLESLSSQYKLAISDYHRDRFSRIHQIVFDLSFIFLTPPLAVVIWRLGIRFQNMQSAVLMGGVSVVFGILSLFSLYYYRFYLSALAPDPSTSERDSGSEVLNESCVCKVGRVASERLEDLREGFGIVLRDPPLRWRLLFLAVETALEDAIVTVVLPQCAITLFPLLYEALTGAKQLPGGCTYANLVAVVWIAIGKLGGFIASVYAGSKWAATEVVEIWMYKRLFKYVFWGACALLLLPLALLLLLYPTESESVISASLSFFQLSSLSLRHIRLFSCCAFLTLSSLLFFILSTAPKVGFASLLHFLIVQRNIDAKIFGFVGVFVTLIDALVIFGLSYLFASTHFLYALTATSLVYLTHGLVELMLGPKLILRAAFNNAYAPEDPADSEHELGRGHMRQLEPTLGGFESSGCCFNEGFDFMKFGAYDQQQQQQSPPLAAGEVEQPYAEQTVIMPPSQTTSAGSWA